MGEHLIAVTPEGRDGVWLPDRDSLKAWIVARGFEVIHNFATSVPGMMIGADHDVEGVLADIDKAEKVAVLTGDAAVGNARHALALIMPADDLLPTRLEMYDVGPVTEADLSVSHG